MEGRTVWVQDGDVDGRIEAGSVVTAARELEQHSACAAMTAARRSRQGTALQIVETRGWGAAMAEELPALSEDGDADCLQVDADAWKQRGA